jgi:alanyl-tRNA synthetase
MLIIRMNKYFSINEIRKKFLEFFEKNGHKILPSSSVVPYGDDTLLFTNSGMVQFKDVFTGLEKPSFKRATTSQKCIRAGGKHNDLENVGYTARHHTFFEMLGNFSFGDYFKEDAIAFAWDFLTNHLFLPKDKLYVTIYHDDDEAFDLWKRIAGLSDDRIIRISTKDNFWEMGDSGPCGPCSEIFYDYGSQYKGGLPGMPEQDDGERYIEIWNLVFMQFEKVNGELKPLPKKSVDTGMGLERIAAVCQCVHDNYQIDLFHKIIEKIEELSGVLMKKDMQNQNYICARVIADHLRSSCFLIADGVNPGNNGREYVLKRIIRRAVIYLYKMGSRESLIYKLVDTLVELMGDVYSELVENAEKIRKIIREEEESFFETIIRGFKEFDEILETLSSKKIISGEQAFKLYDTFGLPLDLTVDIAKSNNLEVDVEKFELLMKEQKDRSKASWKSDSNQSVKNNENLLKISEKYGETIFVGYEKNEEKSELIAIIDENGNLLDNVEKAKKVSLIFKSTPCYAESGGQIGDEGVIFDSQNNLIAKIFDLKKISGLFLHEAEIFHEMKSGSEYLIDMNDEKRQKIRVNHTATHLLHKVLKDVIDRNTNQKGSIVTDEKLRFDFNCSAPLTDEQIREIENRINQAIANGLEVKTQIMKRDDAVTLGAMALFDEKYAENVRVVSIDENFSIELCGGTHVENINEILLFKIVKEEAIASGIRRIEAVTGNEAFKFLNEKFYLFKEICDESKNKMENFHEYFHNLKAKNLSLEKELQEMKREFIFNQIRNVKSEKVDDVELVIFNGKNFDSKLLREISLKFMNEKDKIYFITNKIENNLSIFLICSSNISEKYSANVILKKLAEEFEFKPGGGSKTMASTGAQGVDERILSDKLRNMNLITV